jgi:hypothetical protein
MPISSNKPFFIAIITMLILDTVFVFMPNPSLFPEKQATVGNGLNPIANFFLLEPFVKYTYNGMMPTTTPFLDKAYVPPPATGVEMDYYYYR